jgi:hypothetical protein
LDNLIGNLRKIIKGVIMPGLKKPPMSLEELDEKTSPKGERGALGYQEESKGRFGKVPNNLTIAVVVAVVASALIMVQYAGSKSDVLTLASNVETVNSNLDEVDKRVQAETVRIDNVVNAMGKYVKKDSISGFATKGELDAYAKKVELPRPVDLSAYAKKEDITGTVDLSGYVEVGMLDGYAKLEDIPAIDLGGYVKKEDIGRPDIKFNGDTVSVTSFSNGQYALKVTLLYRPPVKFTGSSYGTALNTFYDMVVPFSNRTYIPILVRGNDRSWMVEQVTFYSKAFDLNKGEERIFNMPIEGLGGFGLYEVVVELVDGVYGNGIEDGGSI